MSKVMKRQTLHLLILSSILLIGIIVFAFVFMIPKGKEYRALRLENKKQEQELETVQLKHDRTAEKLKELQSKNRHIISAFVTPFNPERFTKLYSKEFEDLYLTELESADDNDSFRIYEVNATSKITSPQSFYNFLEGVNKSDWIIAVNFPIHFERDGERIRASFTMKVHNYSSQQEEKQEKSAKK